MFIEIPENRQYEITHLLLDYNGTIALDGEIFNDIKEKIRCVSEMGVSVHILTADTNGTVIAACEGLSVQIDIFEKGNAAEKKEAVVVELGAENCMCIGNGYNDRRMFQACALSIAVLGVEGTSVAALNHADIVCREVIDAFDLILKNNRLIATLRD